jgi:hypothetical protein
VNEPNSLNFELVLLERMPREYKLGILREIGLTESQAAELRGTSILQYPDFASSDLSTYREILGPEVSSDHAGLANRVRRRGSTPHHFLTILWPHLFFVVEEFDGSTSCGVAFENQASPDLEKFDSANVRAGLWTRRALEELADGYELYDGWDEEVVIRFTFGSRQFEGRFVLGLLHEWRSP